jgi:Fic family protein
MNIPGIEVETRAVLKGASTANRSLAELKGIAKTIPNESILLSTLPWREAKDSSEVESIVTTHDELFRSDLQMETESLASKEVRNYVNALLHGFELVRKTGLLTCNHILEIHQKLESNHSGFRRLPGTTLKNNLGDVIYTPPQDPEEIVQQMSQLERFINDPELSDLDSLVKMAIIHHRFESIHPFYDGNGRTGRIINILYLVLQGYLDLPTLYLSSHVIKNKTDYYRLLQQTRDTGDWEPWILFMLKGVDVTSRSTLRIVEAIRTSMAEYKLRLRRDHPKLYSQELLNHLFRQPYTKIEFLERDLKVTRQTASKYLDQLSHSGLIGKKKQGRANYYINSRLVGILVGE